MRTLAVLFDRLVTLGMQPGDAWDVCQEALVSLKKFGEFRIEYAGGWTRASIADSHHWYAPAGSVVLGF
jgi:hypothetical protein